MSRREPDGRDSHGKRIHSRFDREPSPKKAKRDEKSEVEQTHSSHHHLTVINMGDQKQKQQQFVQGDVPLEPSPVTLNVGALENARKHLQVEVDRLSVGGQHSSDHREVPRPRSYYQHNDRGSVGHGGRSIGHRIITDHRRRSDSRERYRNGTRDMETHNQQKEGRSQSHAIEWNVWQLDKFHELDSRVTPARKRHSFREKKMPAEPEPAAPESATARREERGVFHHRSERNIAQSGERFEGMRGRSNNNRFNGRYEGRDIHNSRGFEVEKWKHDLFDEANKSPPPKNEEEHIAKIEALLAL